MSLFAVHFVPPLPVSFGYDFYGAEPPVSNSHPIACHWQVLGNGFVFWEGTAEKHHFSLLQWLLCASSSSHLCAPPPPPPPPPPPLAPPPPHTHTHTHIHTHFSSPAARSYDYFSSTASRFSGLPSPPPLLSFFMACFLPACRCAHLHRVCVQYVKVVNICSVHNVISIYLFSPTGDLLVFPTGWEGEKKLAWPYHVS